jgi:hypothetical protein
MLAHARVVDELALAVTVLPARFGSALEREDAVRELLRERAAGFAARLASVHGLVEVGVRAMRVEAGTSERGDAQRATAARGAGGQAGAARGARASAAAAPRQTGRDYLLAKLRERGEAGRAADALDQRLARLARERRVLLSRDPRELLRAAYLVAPGDVEAVRRAVAGSERACAELAVLCTGPWPPYSFVEAPR